MSSQRDQLPLRTRILFVCAGNTCRGPIAAALAESILPDAVVRSAGLMPGYAVAENAISVIKEMTGADISGHVPGDLVEHDLTRFDRIVALDRFVAEDLGFSAPSDADLVVWDISDPYGRSLDDYRRCAETLQAHIHELAIGEFRKDLRRWRTLLTEITPTHCQGIANKASRKFKDLLRQLIDYRVSAVGYDLDALLKQAGHKNARGTGKLSQGKVTRLVLELTKHDTALEEACTPEVRQSLQTIVEVRNQTTYEVPPDDMREATAHLLDLIELILDDDPLMELLRVPVGP